MGKKSKRKGNNKPSPCYHGCTKQEFNNRGEHYKVLERWSGEHYKIIEEWDMATQEDVNGFYEKYKHVLVNPSFGRYAIANITDDYLKGKNDDLLSYRLLLVIQIRYVYIPRNEGKDVRPESEITKNYHKYARDIETERGRIKFMAREITCKCMDEKKKEAKLMKKVAKCWCCETDFPKEKLLRCKGCDHVQYCSKECSITHWPEHREWCHSVSSASAPTLASVPSSVEESTDVDAEEE